MSLMNLSDEASTIHSIFEIKTTRKPQAKPRIRNFKVRYAVLRDFSSKNWQCRELFREIKINITNSFYRTAFNLSSFKVSITLNYLTIIPA